MVDWSVAKQLVPINLNRLKRGAMWEPDASALIASSVGRCVDCVEINIFGL